MYKTKSESQCKLWTWAIMCQCGFMDCNNVPLWWGMFGAGGRETVHLWGRGYMGNHCLLVSLAVHPKLLFKVY